MMNIEKYKNIGTPVKACGHNILPYLLDLVKYMEYIGIPLSPMPKVVISSDSAYQTDPFGKTAYYNPHTKTVVLYTAGRHIKDVLRSFAHELIHHSQNITGMFDPSNIPSLNNPRYAQEDPHLRMMEEDAYLRGKMSFRAWEDQYK
jgi:hypothetical protein